MVRSGRLTTILTRASKTKIISATTTWQNKSKQKRREKKHKELITKKDKRNKRWQRLGEGKIGRKRWDFRNSKTKHKSWSFRSSSLLSPFSSFAPLYFYFPSCNWCVLKRKTSQKCFITYKDLKESKSMIS